MLLEGRQGLIVGVANKRSIAWGIAEALHREGARLAFNYQGERLEGNVRKLTDTLEGSVVLPCDVTRPEEIDALFGQVGEALSSILRRRDSERRSTSAPIRSSPCRSAPPPS